MRASQHAETTHDDAATRCTLQKKAATNAEINEQTDTMTETGMIMTNHGPITTPTRRPSNQDKRKQVVERNCGNCKRRKPNAKHSLQVAAIRTELGPTHIRNATDAGAETVHPTTCDHSKTTNANRRTQTNICAALMPRMKTYTTTTIAKPTPQHCK